MFDFEWKIKKAFRKVKEDIENLKENVNEWVVFLDGKNDQIEKRLDKIENMIERLEEAMFKILSLR